MDAQLELIAEPRDQIPVRFYLGIHMSQWLHNGRARGPVFVSIRRLRDRKSAFPRATVPYALDSGAYTELAQLGGWKTTPEQYVEAVRRVAAGLGAPDFIVIQDWLCDPGSLQATGLSVEEHQRRTVQSAIRLGELAPDLPWLPVLQGDGIASYMRHLDMYEAAGIPLSGRLVGLGSIVRRQHRPETKALAALLEQKGLRLHGFGVKATGIHRIGRHLASGDSIAWSYHARRDGAPAARNSQGVAEAYRDVVTSVCAGMDPQDAMLGFEELAKDPQRAPLVTCPDCGDSDLRLDQEGLECVGCGWCQEGET